jgi:hypothetical protein
MTAALVAYCLLGTAVAENAPITLEEDRIRFVFANTVFVLLHELGHGLIHEFDLPVLGEEEDAADTIASIFLLNAERLNPEMDAFANKVLLSASEGQKLLWETGLEEAQIDLFYWARHSLSIRRYHRIVCLVYGSDPQRFMELLQLAMMPEYRSDSCEEEYALAERSVAAVTEHMRDGKPIGPPIAVDIPVRGEQTDDDLGRRLAKILRQQGTLSKVLSATDAYAALPPGMVASLEDCEYPGAYWDPDDNTLIVCYQLLSMFYELSADQKLPDFLRERDTPIGNRN